ncbi:folate-binding protein [Roseibium sp. RKSG952]|nr:folate-binding protein [Roseibium sp. RKSG952]
MHFAELTNRALLRISGDPSHDFLQNLITADMEDIDRQGIGFSALLTPQGKIQFDFFVIKTGDGYLLDADTSVLADLRKRLTFYRLRTKVMIEPDERSVFALWNGMPGSGPELVLEDPRLSALGARVIGEAGSIRNALTGAGGQEVSIDAYAAHRLAQGVPEALSDFQYSDIFPHDADMDQLNGVSFTKGCYVGQEIVSRMQHRGTARKRFIEVGADSALPEPGTPVLADGKSVGTLGSHAEIDGKAKGVALVRLDKVRAALDKSAPITCGDVPIHVHLPAWASFSWPETAGAD